MPRTRDKLAFDAVFQQFEQIKKSLAHCTTFQELQVIINQKKLIDTHCIELRRYMARRQTEQRKFRDLESRINLAIVQLSRQYKNLSLLQPILEEDEGILKEKEIRSNQLHSYNNLLKQLKAKRNELHHQFPNDKIEDVDTPYGAISKLIINLQEYAELYKHQQIDLDKFKEQSSKAIRDKREGVLSQHRGMKELLANLLLAIGTLGIGYVLAALFTQSFTPIKCNTKTANLLDETKNALNEITSRPV